MTGASPAALLGPGDPVPVEVVNPAGSSRIVLVCEHAGRAVPSALGNLGLSPEAMERHIAWDIGAEGVARGLSDRLDSALVVQRYSRLVIDCNRPFTAPDLIPEVSDGQTVPGNRGIDDAARRRRYDAIHAPFHDRVADLMDRHPAGGRTVLVTIHSFTPMLAARPAPRPWHLGLLSRHRALAERLMPVLEAMRPGLVAAHDEPYRITDDGDYAIPVHGEARGIEHVMFEIRNDLIAMPAGQADWATFLAAALTETLAD